MILAYQSLPRSLINLMSTTETVKVKSKTSQWLTKGIMVYFKQKSELYKTLKNNPTTQNEKYIKRFKIN